MKSYKGHIDILPENGIFVFGSNTEGRHGKGAALIAKEKFGAIYGKSQGLQGRSYAIVTKDLNSNIQPSRTPEQIKEEIKNLYKFAIDNKDLDFYIAYTTLQSRNLNAYSTKELAYLFASFDIIPSNIIFEEGFLELIKSFRNQKVVIIAGGRDFNNYSLLEEYCYKILSPLLEKGIEIIIREGEARGVDTLAVRFALENNLPLQRYPADWSLGKRAGFIRNKNMAEGLNGDNPANILIAFWDGKSRGTKSMIDIMNDKIFTSVYICSY